MGDLATMAFFISRREWFTNNRREAVKMLRVTTMNDMTKLSLFEEDVYCELQKWERCASP